MISNKLPIYIILAVMLLTVLSCGMPAKNLTITETATPPTWIIESLENPACLPPCWENITPGISKIDDAENVQYKYPHASFDVKRGTSLVQMITLNLSIFDNLPSERLISRYGQPNYVRIYKCDPNARCETHLIYIDLGIVMNTYPENSGDFLKPMVLLSPSTGVFNLFFLETGLNNYYNNFGGDATQITPWNGFGNYSIP